MSIADRTTWIMVAMFMFAGIAVGVALGTAVTQLEDEDLTAGVVVECRDSVIVRIAVLNGLSGFLTEGEQAAVRTLPPRCLDEAVLEEMNPVTLDLLEASPVDPP